jgi:Amt family ammonium transporter
MAERTEFKAYFFYSIFISAIIYPVSGHWTWGGGWLSQMATPFHDFAGSTVVHMVGGIVALTGAMALGPRIGKYNGKKSNAIPDITVWALGMVSLGWFALTSGSSGTGTLLRSPTSL